MLLFIFSTVLDQLPGLMHDRQARHRNFKTLDSVIVCLVSMHGTLEFNPLCQGGKISIESKNI